MATHEIGMAFSWLIATLSGDTTLAGSNGYAPGGVWRAEAPPSTTTPFVIVAHQPPSNGDAVVFGGGRAYSDLLFQVNVTGPAKVMQAVVNAASRIDTLITTAAPIVVAGNAPGTVIASFRQQPIEEDVLIDGELWTNMGGVYRVFAKGS